MLGKLKSDHFALFKYKKVFWIHIPPQQPVNINGNVFENCNYFKSSRINYRIAISFDKVKDEIITVATLLSIIGKETFFMHQHLDISKEDR